MQSTMQRLKTQQIRALRQRLEALRRVLDTKTQQRMDSLLRKAALGLKLTEAEAHELRILLCADQTSCKKVSEDDGDAQKPMPQKRDDAPQMSTLEILLNEIERPMRIEWTRCAFRSPFRR